MLRSVQVEITELLRRWRAGDADALDRLAPRVYAELRSRAHRFLRRERDDHTFQTTDLVHETFLRLVDQRRVEWHDRNHFLAVAAQAMRRILVDHARRQHASNRIGAHRRAALEPARIAGTGNGSGTPAAVLDVDRALDRLERLDRRQARLVELRFFAGMTVREAAEVLGVSVPTATRDWRMAKAWLATELADVGLRS